ncbi:hypothetical protein OIDMADRAFT_144406 [Oidiodendron maius Zn]|uniref:Uncharacterized protein n=1 Tax=Oidiodendron maius (strain Zn) TaxID=913774 RepID=A0A0C3HHD5_OIDMZ|nr:hypothetical protein OIDMADRAFT_144406 [Oidiodendron maius Zn]
MDAPQASNSNVSIATTTVDATMTKSPPKYVPQFSAATEMILKRINSGVGSTNFSSLGITGTPPGYEDMRRSVLMGMKTSMNMEIPSPSTSSGRRSTGGRGSSGPVTGHSTGAFAVSRSPASARQNNGASGTGKGRKRGSKTGQKRKRTKDESDSSGSDSAPMSGLGEDSDSDDNESITELPRMTLSGRAVVKPTQFVPAASEVSRKRGPPKRTQEHALWVVGLITSEGSRGKGVVSKRQVTEFPYVILKRAYFSSLPHQQLVSLLMQACVLHPNLPLFPSAPSSNSVSASIPPQRTSSSQPPSQTERRINIHPQQPFPPPATAGLFSRAESNPSAPINFIRKIAPGSQSSAKDSPQPELKQSSAPPTINVSEEAAADDSRESTPVSPPYPKPGSGLMAKLGPDDEDIEWLVDDGDFDAFSHVVYDGDGNTM